MRDAIHPNAPGAAVGLTEPAIRNLVETFYAAVRRDPVLGPIFESKIDDWPAHLAKLTDFWSSVLLMTGRYKGRPMPVHAAIPNLTRDHFERWLGLFRNVARDVCSPGAAALFIERAERIAESLYVGVSIHRGEGPVIAGSRFCESA